MAAILRASSAHRWGPGGCPGSPTMEAAFPQEDSPEARQGTAAHYYVTEMLQGRAHPLTTLAPNGHPLDAEMVECGRSFLDDVWAEVNASGPGHQLFVEQLLTMHKGVHPDNEGTPDTWLYDQHNWRVIIWDYKHGHGFVPVFENWQLIDYFAGVVERLNLSFENINSLKVSLRVVAPRNFNDANPVRRWDTTGGVLTSYVQKLRAAAKEAREPDAPCRTGPHCDNCDAIHACPAALALGSRIVDMAGRAVPAALTPSGLAMALFQADGALERLKALREGLEADGAARLKRGETIPGWRMGNRGARERWTVPPESVILAGQLVGVDVKKPTEVITPKQARDAGLDPSIVEVFSERPLGSAKLVAVSAADAAKIFPQPQGT